MSSIVLIFAPVKNEVIKIKIIGKIDIEKIYSTFLFLRLILKSVFLSNTAIIKKKGIRIKNCLKIKTSGFVK